MTKKLIRSIIATLLLAIFVIVIVFFGYSLKNEPQKLPSAMLGKQLPSFALPSLDGKRKITNNDMPKEPFLINVWGSWCEICYREHNYLNTLAQTIKIIGLNFPADNENEIQKAKKMLKDFGNPYQLIMTDEQANLITSLGVYGAPETFLISSNGTILFRYEGELKETIWKQNFLPLLTENNFEKINHEKN